ncbi:MAG: hypothetical protein K1X74_05340 [Pirellulales bacterium]|nr:hypothetical protein [Pirellulales bacterium]
MFTDTGTTSTDSRFSERHWAMAALLLGVLGSMTRVPLLGVALPAAVFYFQRQRSPFAAFYGLQAAAAQAAVVALGVADELFAQPIDDLVHGAGVIAWLAINGLSIYTAFQARAGEVDEFWLIGPWARRHARLTS